MRKGPTAKWKPYPTTITDEEWAFVAPYLTLCREDAPQREYPLRAVYNALRRMAAGCFEMLVHDLRALLRVTDDRAKKRNGSKGHIAVDTLGHLLALTVTPANEQERSQVEALAAAVQTVTGETVELAYVDQGYMGENARAAAATLGR